MCCSPNNVEILSYTECDYFSTLLIRQMQGETNDNFPKVDLAAYFKKAKLTIEVLTDNMVKPEVLNTIFFEHYNEVNIESVVKLLLRATQLYNARQSAQKILKFVTEIE